MKQLTIDILLYNIVAIKVGLLLTYSVKEVILSTIRGGDALSILVCLRVLSTFLLTRLPTNLIVSLSRSSTPSLITREVSTFILVTPRVLNSPKDSVDITRASYSNIASSVGSQYYQVPIIILLVGGQELISYS